MIYQSHSNNSWYKETAFGTISKIISTIINMEKSSPTKHLKLPFSFDEEKLTKELNSIMQEQWTAHHYKMSYDGEWTSMALYATEGKEDNIFAGAGANAAFEETPTLKNCPYLQEVIQHFECPLICVRLLRLGGGSEIKPHRDFKLGYEDDNFRLHIPITTNDGVSFILDGERLKMLPGECWYTNVNYIHSVSNKGQTDRIHLVIDGERNSWSDQLFFSLAPRESFNLRDSNDSEETIKRMLEELRQRDEPASKLLIEELENKLLQLNGES